MSSKSWKYLAATYVVLYIVFVAIESHGLQRAPLSPIEKILAAPMMWGLAVYGVQGGSVMGRFSWVDRDEKPFTFWFIITFEVLYGLFLFCWGMRDAFR